MHMPATTLLASVFVNLKLYCNSLAPEFVKQCVLFTGDGGLLLCLDALDSAQDCSAEVSSLILINTIRTQS